MRCTNKFTVAHEKIGVPYDFSVTQIKKYISGNGGMECQNCGNYAEGDDINDWISGSEETQPTVTLQAFRRRRLIRCPECGSNECRSGLFIGPPEHWEDEEIEIDAQATSPVDETQNNTNGVNSTAGLLLKYTVIAGGGTVALTFVLGIQLIQLLAIAGVLSMTIPMAIYDYVTDGPNRFNVRISAGKNRPTTATTHDMSLPYYILGLILFSPVVVFSGVLF